MSRRVLRVGNGARALATIMGIATVARITTIGRMVTVVLVAGVATTMTIIAGMAAEAHAASSSPRFSRSDIVRVDRLLAQIQSRLQLAPKSAALRWTSMTRIEDSEGEQRTLDSVRTQSRRLALDADAAVAFGRAQIEAEKSIEAARHRQWTLDAKSAPPRNVERGATDVAYPLSTQQLRTLDDAELRALRDALPVLRRAGGRQLLDARAADVIQVGGSDLIASQIALKPLYDIAR